MIPRFFSAGSASDPGYGFNRDHRSRKDLREAIEEMWARYAPFCGDELTHFLADARAHFNQRTWELRVACTFLEKGLELRRPPAGGPDLCVVLDGRLVWVEATAPVPGDGPDAPRRFTRANGVFALDRDAIILRYTSALLDKSRQRTSFLRRGLIAASDAFAVAINAGSLQDADIRHFDTPDIVRSVYPIGDPVFRIPVRIDGSADDEPVRPELHVPLRWSIRKKATGREIPTYAFLDPQFAGISGLLFSAHGIWNMTALHGDDWVIVHNLHASFPLAAGALPWGMEYWVGRGADAFLEHRDWRARDARAAMHHDHQGQGDRQ